MPKWRKFKLIKKYFFIQNESVYPYLNLAIFEGYFMNFDTFFYNQRRWDQDTASILHFGISKMPKWKYLKSEQVNGFLSATSGYIRYYVGRLVGRSVPNLMSKIFSNSNFSALEFDRDLGFSRGPPSGIPPRS